MMGQQREMTQFILICENFKLQVMMYDVVQHTHYSTPVHS